MVLKSDSPESPESADARSYTIDVFAFLPSAEKELALSGHPMSSEDFSIGNNQVLSTEIMATHRTLVTAMEPPELSSQAFGPKMERFWAR